MTKNQIVAVKILNLEAQIAPLEDIVHEAQTMKVSWKLHLFGHQAVTTKRPPPECSTAACYSCGAHTADLMLKALCMLASC